jgi:hypothetical protein
MARLKMAWKRRWKRQDSFLSCQPMGKSSAAATFSDWGVETDAGIAGAADVTVATTPGVLVCSFPCPDDGRIVDGAFGAGVG